jgi:hypothetical protein
MSCPANLKKYCPLSISALLILPTKLMIYRETLQNIPHWKQIRQSIPQLTVNTDSVANRMIVRLHK